MLEKGGGFAVEISPRGIYSVGIVLFGMHTPLHIDLLHVHSCKFHTPTSSCHTECMTWGIGKGCVGGWYTGLCPKYMAPLGYVHSTIR